MNIKYLRIIALLALTPVLTWAARDGSGNYNLPAGNPVVSGTPISSSVHNTTMSDVGAALTQSISKDGQTTATANLPMGGFRHTNVANATVRNNYLAAGQATDGAHETLTSISGTNTITATGPLGMTAYASGQRFTFKAAGANTAAVTLNVSGLGAKSVFKNGLTANLEPGDIPAANAVVHVFYDGTQFQLLSPTFSPTRGAVTVQAPTSGLVIYRTTTNIVQITADFLLLSNTSGISRQFTALSVSPNITNAGAGGLDTGSEAVNTWYYIWAVGQDAGTVSAMFSASSTAPTMPSGYTFKGRIGAIFNDSGGALREHIQHQNIAMSPQLKLVNGGTATSLTSITLTTLVPPTAIAAYVATSFIEGTAANTQYSVFIAPANSAVLERYISFVRGPSGSVKGGFGGEARIGFIPGAQALWYRSSSNAIDTDIELNGWEL